MRPGPVLAALVAAAVAGQASADPVVGGARLRPAAFADLAGWPDDDHGAAFRTFRRSCPAVLSGDAPPRPAQEPGRLRKACEAAAALGGEPDGLQARLFFERWFAPFRVVPPSGAGFLTGYFEPEVEGSAVATPHFTAPLLARPDDLVSLSPGETLPGLDPALQAARRGPEGWEPYPDRAAIEAGALGALARPLLYLRDPVDVFIIQVQGSARVRLADGRALRVAYAGRNGHPYTSIGRLMVQRGLVPLPEMNLERMTAWLRANPEQGRALMRENRSYVFFRVADELSPEDGPIGGAGVPLTPERSLAVDRTLWAYGLPVWLEGELPRPEGAPEPLRRLMIAQDTGSAILGPARGDYYFGSGAAAGTRAGLLRHPVGFTVLLPRAEAEPGTTP